ncbi:MAG: hypothetical protein RLO52_00455, partial [Sandaracinaceae bacterium]
LPPSAGSHGGWAADSGRDSGPADAVADAAPDAEADSGICDEFMPELCPREYPNTPINLRDLCQVFADVFCRANQNCCTRIEDQYSSYSTCIMDQEQRCEFGERPFEVQASVTAGEALYSGGAAGDTLARLGPMADACEPVRLGPELDTAYTGLIASGEACDAWPECEDRSFCLPFGAPDAICRLAPNVGTACTSHRDCATRDYRCGSDGMCAERLADGESCLDSFECESLLCMDGTCAEFTGDTAFCVDLDGPGDAFGY